MMFAIPSDATERLRPTEYGTLMWLVKNLARGPLAVAVRAIGKELGVSHTHVAKTINVMVEAGYIEVVTPASGPRPAMLRWVAR